MNNNSATLVRLFAEFAEKRGAAMEDGDSKVANKYFDQQLAAYKQLKTQVASAPVMLLPLLKSDNLWIRCEAATLCLISFPEEAVKVLESIHKAAKSPSLRMSAWLALQQWRSGKLQLP